MLEMTYNDVTDTVSLANKNRVTSKKLFEQLHYHHQQQQQQQQQSSRVPTHIAFIENHMLHRTPSGAQKRIRQRQEQKWLKAVSSTPPATSDNEHSHAQSQKTGPEKNTYRSMIDSGGYKSILPEEPFLSLSTSATATTSKNGIGCPPSLASANAISNALANSNSPSNASGGKPTVQVHPMPSGAPNGTLLTTLTNDAECNVEKVREKPAVPKKPAKLILSSASLESSSLPAMSSLSLSLSTSSLNLLSPSTPVSPSTSSLRLFSTPSLMCLHTEMMQPSLTAEEIERLDAKRKKLIESISRKVAILDEESSALDEEIRVNEALRKEVFDELIRNGDFQVIEKVENNLKQNSQLCRLETRLRMQLERLETIYTNSSNADKELSKARIDRVKRQLIDQTVLRKAFDRRDAIVDDYVLSNLNEERGAQWRAYKQAWMRLASERQEIDERLQLGRDQLNALQNVQPLI